MGASESTARPSNRTQEEEERERQQQQQNMSSIGAAVGVAVGAAVAAWGISRMLSGNAETEEKHEEAMMHNRNVSVITESYVPPHRRPNGTSTHGLESYPTTSHVWIPPPPSRFKMNTDAGCRPNEYQDGKQGPSGCGGILRDHLGNCLRGFQEFIDMSDCLTAEFKGILKGLLILDKLGLQGSTLESDSAQAIRWINRKDSPDPDRIKSQVIRAIWGDIMECKRLKEKNGIQIIKCRREANKCAHKLADMAIDKKARYMEFTSDNVPDEIMRIVDDESNRWFDR